MSVCKVCKLMSDIQLMSLNRSLKPILKFRIATFRPALRVSGPNEIPFKTNKQVISLTKLICFLNLEFDYAFTSSRWAHCVTSMVLRFNAYKPYSGNSRMFIKMNISEVLLVPNISEHSTTAHWIYSLNIWRALVFVSSSCLFQTTKLRRCWRIFSEDILKIRGALKIPAWYTLTKPIYFLVELWAYSSVENCLQTGTRWWISF